RRSGIRLARSITVRRRRARAGSILLSRIRLVRAVLVASLVAARLRIRRRGSLTRRRSRLPVQAAASELLRGTRRAPFLFKGWFRMSNALPDDGRRAPFEDLGTGVGTTFHKQTGAGAGLDVSASWDDIGTVDFGAANGAGQDVAAPIPPGGSENRGGYQDS